MAVVWFRLRAVGRQRWRAWLALALLVGLGGGIVLGALAGARRTDSAYGRFLKEVNAFDVALAGEDLEAVRRLPQVADVAGNDFLLMEKEGDDRRFDLSPLLPAGDGMYERINGLKILKGRRPNPSRADEVSISRIGAETYGLGVGDAVVMKAFAPDQLEAVLGGEPPSPAGPRFMFRVVGIDATPTEFLPTSPNPATIHLTPAFGRTHGHEVAAIPGLAIKLKAGGADVDAFKREVERITGEAGVQFITGGLDAAQVQRSIQLQVVALRLFAALMAIAAMLILGQAFARQAAIESLDKPTLRAVGVNPAQLWAVSMAQVGTIATTGALTAVGIAFALSPLSPIGLARDAEPAPGLAFDPATLGLGGAAIIALALAIAALPTWRAVRVRPRDQLSATSIGDRPSRLVGSLAAMGFPVAAMTGVRMAVTPGRASGSAPIRNAALVSTIICISAIAVVATFGTSLQRLLSTPPLYGWNWDVVVGSPFSSDTADQTVPILTGADSVAGVSSVAFVEIDVAGARATALGFDPVLGSVLPPVVDGREPRQPDEVLLGTKTLRDIGTEVGKTVTVRIGDRAMEVRVVGRGVLPGVADALDQSGLGEGALFTDQGLRRLVPDVPRNLFAVRFAEGVNAEAAASQLSERVGEATGPEPPRSVADFGRVNAMPAVLVGLLALLAVATLAHTSLTLVRRRRRELAILKTLGFVRGQVQATIAFQVTALMLMALLVGAPLGLAAGRWTWRLFADSLGVVPAPIVPLAVALGMVPAAIFVANVIAAIPGRMASRVQPAFALQAE